MSAILSYLCPELLHGSTNEEFINLCNSTLVETAVLNEKKKRIRIELSAPMAINEKTHAQIHKYMTAQFLGFDVKLIIKFPLETLTKDAVLSLVSDLPAEKSVAKCYLHSCVLTVENSTVNIHLTSTADMLHEMSFCSELEKLLYQRTGEKVRVILHQNSELAILQRPCEEIKHTEKPKQGIYPKDVLPKNIADTLSEKSVSVAYGSLFHSKKVMTIDELGEGKNQCTVMGKVFSFEELTKPHCTIISVGINDGSGSICMKWVVRAADKPPKPLKVGDIVVVRGKHVFDPYRREMIIQPSDVLQVYAKQRVDEAEKPRIELHLHTKASAMDGLCDVEEAIFTACAMGHKAVAITDHGVVQSFPKAMKVCKKAQAKYPDFKVIYGCEVYYVPTEKPFSTENDAEKKRSNFHMILLAKNQAGLKNLYHIISESHLNHYHSGRGAGPRVPQNILDTYREGLLVGSACEAGELFQAVKNGESEEILLEIASYYDFLEIQPIMNNAFLLRDGFVSSEQVLQEYNSTILKIGKKLNKPVVATGDVHFLHEEDAEYRTVLQAAQGYQDADIQPPLYYRTTAEMLAEFSYLSSEDAHDVVVRYPNEIADMINGDIIPVPMDRLYIPEIEGSEELLQETVWKNAHRRFGEAIPDIVKNRLEEELHGITSSGYAVLYVIARKLVKYSEENGYTVGSRGSVGSSAVAHFADISEVNPLPPHYLCPRCKHSEFVTDGSVTTGYDLPKKQCPSCEIDLEIDGHDIPFETFLGFGGRKVPDIDLNFSGEVQALAHKYTEELFGSENVFRAGTVMGLAEKTAQSYAYKYLAEYSENVSNIETYRLAQKITGVKKTTSQHPGAMVVLPSGYDIHDFTPLQYPSNDASKGVITTHFEFGYLHDTLLKLDELGHVVPTLYKYLESFTGIGIYDVPTQDPKVFSLLTSTKALGVDPKDIGSDTGTFGIPELGTPLVRQMLCEAAPKSFGDLIQISGLSHGTGVWKGNAQDLIQSGQCTISEVIGTRDSIMLYLIRKGIEAKAAFDITERVRKSVVNKEGFSDEEKKLLAEHKIPQWYIESCKKIEYMFPKAHAVAYLMAAVKLMWYKLYHPKEFYAAYFTARGKGMDYEAVMKGNQAVKKKIKALTANKYASNSAKDEDTLTALQLANECLHRGIEFLPVELSVSCAVQYKVEENGIRMPYSAIAGIGGTAATQLEKTALPKTEYCSVEEFMSHTKTSTAIAELLTNCGALSGMNLRNQLSFLD